MKKFDVMAVLVGFRPARMSDFYDYEDERITETYTELDVRCTVTTTGSLPTRRQVKRAVRNLGKEERLDEGMKYRQVSHAIVYTYPVGDPIAFHRINPLD